MCHLFGKTRWGQRRVVRRKVWVHSRKGYLHVSQRKDTDKCVNETFDEERVNGQATKKPNNRASACDRAQMRVHAHEQARKRQRVHMTTQNNSNRGALTEVRAQRHQLAIVACDYHWVTVYTTWWLECTPNCECEVPRLHSPGSPGGTHERAHERGGNATCFCFSNDEAHNNLARCARCACHPAPLRRNDVALNAIRGFQERERRVA